MSNAKYPGQGDPWSDFLHHRARAMRTFKERGDSNEEIARLLSMNGAEHVERVLDYVLKNPKEFEP